MGGTLGGTGKGASFVWVFWETRGRLYVYAGVHGVPVPLFCVGGST